MKDKYNILMKKYNLPEYEDLNLIFELDDIPIETTLVLQKIRGRINEKIEYLTGIIEIIIQPDNNLSDLHEAHHLEDKYKENAFKLFKKLKHIMRYSDLVSIDNTEQQNASFIIESYNYWLKSRDEIKEYLTKLKFVWLNESSTKNDLDFYFG